MGFKITPREQHQIAQLHEAIREEFRNLGYGSQKKILAQAGISKSGFEAAFYRGSIKVAQLLRILAIMDIEPGEFFARAFPVALKPPPGDPPPGVATVLRRIVEEDWDAGEEEAG